jgi:metal-responsive CopG/Arc/MetJ family transcriptional regulator
MTANIDEKQIAIKLNDDLIGRLDSLSKLGGMNRSHLMLSFVNIWLNVLETSRLKLIFFVANILRVHEAQMNGEMNLYEHEYSASRIPERAIPIKLSEADIFKVLGHAMKSHISRHQMLQIMIIVGIEELEKITDYKPYQLGDIEKLLFKEFSMLMKKGEKVFKEFIK